jgi:hypothetical protein
MAVYQCNQSDKCPCLLCVHKEPHRLVKEGVVSTCADIPTSCAMVKTQVRCCELANPLAAGILEAAVC